MKKLILITSLIAFSLFSCKKEENISNPKVQNNFLVDKVYDYNHNLLADYIYNNKNQLIKRIDTDPINNKNAEYNFEYKNNRVEKIIYKDHTFPQFSHFTTIQYNQSGKISKAITYKGNLLIGEKNYIFDEEGRIRSLTSSDSIEYFNITYSDSENIKTITLLKNGSDVHKSIIEEQEFKYSYDNFSKPFFGINSELPFEPLPYFGTEATLAKNLSNNNLTINHTSGTEWSYNYYPNGFPSIITVKWKDVETIDPMMWRIKYKVVQKIVEE